MHFVKDIVKRAYNKFTQQHWNVAFIQQSLGDILDGKPIKMNICRHGYKDRWFADPFILDVTADYVYLLVEELYSGWGRGRISKLTINRKKNSIDLVEPILQLDSHLSFPAIKRTGGGILVYPENAKGLGLAIYKYDQRSNDCELLKVVTEKPLADAIITDVLGREMLLATEIPNHNRNCLNLYQLTENDVEKFSEIIFTSNMARNAGDWFLYNGKVYRPAQDCNKCYGGATIIQEVKLESGDIVFNDIRRIISNDWHYITGCHTFNHYKDVTVVDVHGYIYPVLGWIFKTFTPKCLLK